jgi:hypothetical protein
MSSVQINQTVEELQAQCARLAADKAMLDFVQAHPNLYLKCHKGRWSLRPLTSYPYQTFTTLREAITHAMEGNHVN